MKQANVDAVIECLSIEHGHYVAGAKVKLGERNNVEYLVATKGEDAVVTTYIEYDDIWDQVESLLVRLSLQIEAKDWWEPALLPGVVNADI
jgi:hypothetical protein